MKDSILDKYNIPKNKKYVLILCTIEPRKNLIIVIITFYQFLKKNINDMVLGEVQIILNKNIYIT